MQKRCAETCAETCKHLLYTLRLSLSPPSLSPPFLMLDVHCQPSLGIDVHGLLLLVVGVRGPAGESGGGGGSHLDGSGRDGRGSGGGRSGDRDGGDDDFDGSCYCDGSCDCDGRLNYDRSCGSSAASYGEAFGLEEKEGERKGWKGKEGLVCSNGG